MTKQTAADAATLAQGATEKRCRICGNAHWRVPAGWIADHTSEPVDMSVKPTVEQAEADLAAALALLGRALAHLGGPIRADIEDFLRRHDAQPGGGG